MSGLIGRTVGPYSILEQVGQGGMSSVFLAVHQEYGRQVAIKILSPYLAHDPQFKARFEREIKLLRQLQHPHIIPILDFGEADGLTYIVMPYVRTGTLHERLQQGPLDPRQGGQIIDQLASALAYAHEHGVIHRDVKPSNVLVDEQGNALLSDFSVARPQDATQNLTGSALIGTPAYMSPEQVRGEAVDARSDQYAFAVLLYQVTTGTLPFEGETPMVVAMKHVSTPLPRPRQVNPHLPEGVELVLIRALAKDPAFRFDSIEKLNRAFQRELAAALDPALSAADARTIGPERTLALYRRYQNVQPPARPPRRRRSELLAVLLLLLACTVSGGAVAIIYPETFRPAIAAPLATQDVQATVDVLLTANAPEPGVVVDAAATGTAVYLIVLQTLQASLTPQSGTAEVLPQAETSTPEPDLPSPIPPTEEPTATRTLPPEVTPPTPTRTSPPATQAPTTTGGGPSATPSASNTVSPSSPTPTGTSQPPTSTVTSSPVPPTSTQPAPTATDSPACEWDTGSENVDGDTVSVRVYNQGDLPLIVTEVSITWTGNEDLKYIRWRFNSPFWTGNDDGPTVTAGTNYTVPVGSYRTVEFEFWGSDFSGSASVTVEVGC